MDFSYDDFYVFNGVYIYEDLYEKVMFIFWIHPIENIIIFKRGWLLGDAVHKFSTLK